MNESVAFSRFIRRHKSISRNRLQLRLYCLRPGNVQISLNWLNPVRFHQF